jgi:Pyruvate/2-oxoacid:ferredoxin oxidoreductase gamma subunit
VKAGSKVVANTLALSVLNTLVPVVSRESLAAAIAARVPARFRELNQSAGEAGIALASDHAAALQT